MLRNAKHAAGWLAALIALAVAVACSGSTEEEPEPDTRLPRRPQVEDDGGPDGGGASIDAGSNPKDASTDTNVVVDAGDPIPFPNYLVLRVETDAKNGLQADTAWRDLSTHNQLITIAKGAPKVESVGAAGAKAMVFDTTGPIFDVPDIADFRFGATDDFLVVARATITAPLDGNGGCAFHYLFGKYGSDGSSGPHLRVCASDKRELIGSLKLSSNDAKVSVPDALLTTFDVISFGRNQSGKRIETRAGTASVEINVVTPIDVSSVGTPLSLGGAHLAGGSVIGSWIGKVNRLYVYHAPPGMLSNTDFEDIRAYVKSAAPLP
jgi:hypothetical protein